MSAYTEALDTLRAALGDRAWVLVVDLAHADAPGTSMALEGRMGQPTYVTLGLLVEGQARYESVVGRST